MWTKILLAVGRIDDLHVVAVNEWTKVLIEQRERRAPDKDRHRINQDVLPHLSHTMEPVGARRTPVSRQQPQQDKFGPEAVFLGGDRNAVFGTARTVLHFAMERYVQQKAVRQY